LGRDPMTGTTLFQARNVERARVYGAEIGFHADLDGWLAGLAFDAAASWTRGDNRTSHQPLNTIDPAELIAALTWQPNEQSRFALTTTSAAGQDRVDDSLADPFTTDGYTAVDLTASYTTRRGLRVDFGVFNLFDETYWRWSAVRNRASDDPLINLLSAPGRYASVSVHLEI
ncbi:MAG: TonB-dependent receptor, partial [Gammaproteobacteria bacterium]|nr:TonB-dependent receptor [Gammaproteobacteria bacterium]